MGKIILFFCLTVLFSNPSLSQWFDINPLPDGNRLVDISFVNDSTGWIVGSGGLIMKTTNTGLKWIKQSSGTTQGFNAVHFENENLGWCAGQDGIVLKTEDSGESWNIVSTLDSTVNSLHFISENTGWAVGENGLIEKTTDGGSSWTLQNNYESYPLLSVFFISEQKGFAVGGYSTGVLLSTSDGGQSWDSLNYSHSLNTVFFINDSIGWISGYRRILKTTDAGSTWDIIVENSTVGSDYFGEIYFRDEYNGYIVFAGENAPSCANVVRRTTDGGYTWQTGSGLYYRHLHSFYSGCLFVNNNGAGIVAGYKGTIAMTFDYGINWNLLYSGNDQLRGFSLSVYSEEIKAAYVTINNHMYEPTPAISKPLENSGYWILYAFLGHPLEDEEGRIQFVNDTLGFASHYWSLYRTTDGGYSWANFHNFLNQNQILNNNCYHSILTAVSEVFFIDEYYGWFNYSLLFRTTDGGYNWTHIGGEVPYYGAGGLYFLNSEIGFKGLYKTTDGGYNWYEVGGGNVKYFVNDSTGFGVDDNGVIWKTIDIGESWHQINSGTNEDLSGIYFINENRGYVVGANGTILVTTNGGYSWYQQDSGTNDHLFNIDFVDENEGYAIGLNGAFLKTVNSGGTIPVELISLTATTKKGNVLLNWSTATETNNLGFEIERKIIVESRGEWIRIGFVEGAGTTTEPNEYSYSDDINLISAKSLEYRLKQMDFNGSYEYSDIVYIDNPAPLDYKLLQNYPNPFNSNTIIKYGLPEKSDVNLKIYNSLGQQVLTILSEKKEAGNYEVAFDASSLPSGVYFYQLRAGSFVETKKMVLMK